MLERTKSKHEATDHDAARLYSLPVFKEIQIKCRETILMNTLRWHYKQGKCPYQQHFSGHNMPGISKDSTLTNKNQSLTGDRSRTMSVTGREKVFLVLSLVSSCAPVNLLLERFLLWWPIIPLCLLVFQKHNFALSNIWILLLPLVTTLQHFEVLTFPPAPKRFLPGFEIASITPWKGLLLQSCLEEGEEQSQSIRGEAWAEWR